MTDQAALAQALAAGVGGWVLNAMGTDAETLTVALIACSVGSLFAPELSRCKTAAVFLAAVSACAITASVLGPALAEHAGIMGQTAWTKATAIIVGIWLHPIIQVGPEALRGIVRAGLKRIGGGSQ